MATVSTTLGIYAAIILGAIVLAIVLRTPYIAMFAMLGVGAHAIATTPLPQAPMFPFPKKSDGVSWIDASGTPGSGLYSFFPNTDGNVAIWLTDVADASTARGYKITLSESDGRSRLYLLDGTADGNADPKWLDGSKAIGPLTYIDTVTRTSENSVLQIYFVPGFVGVFWIPSGTGDSSPNTGIDYTTLGNKYKHLSYKPTAVDDVLAAPLVVGVVGIETLEDPVVSADVPAVLAPQWLPTASEGAPTTFTLSQSGWPSAKPFDRAQYDAINWTLSNGGRISFNAIYRDTKSHQMGLCVIASPDPFVPPTSADLCVVFEFFVNISDMNFDDMACEIRIQPTGTDMFEHVSSYMCAGPGSCPYKFTGAKAKCDAHVEESTQVHFHERSSCEYLGQKDISEIVSEKTIGKEAPEFGAAIAAACTDGSSGQPPSYYAKVAASSLEMGFLDSSGNETPLATYRDLSDFPTLVSSLKYWGIGLYPVADWTPTTITVSNVKVN